jgi:hypothetical protein
VHSWHLPNGQIVGNNPSGMNLIDDSSGITMIVVGPYATWCAFDTAIKKE